MTDSISELQDIKRFSEGVLEGTGFWGWHDYGTQGVDWIDITHLYILSLQKQGEETVNPQLVFTLREMPSVHLISGRQFKYKTFLGDKFSREHSIEECFRALVEKFVQSSKEAYIDISIRDFLNGGAAFVPKVRNIREILRYHSTIDRRSKQEPLYREEEKEQKIHLKVWEPGEMIDGLYRVQKVYKGGMGVVYIVSEKDSSHNLYAVKMFQEQFLWDKKVADLFFHEAQVWIELEKHRNIVQALFVKTFQGCPALFLEYVDGTDLERELSHGSMDIELALDFALQFCSGMNYAYEKLGIVHRDIKPSNCLLDKDWVLKITDFGLVKIFSDKDEGKASAVHPSQKPGNDAMMGGTLAYMSPEHFGSEEHIDTRSDIYSFGVMLYEMVTGKKPIPGNDIVEYMKNHNDHTPIPPKRINSLIPRDLSTLILHCLEKRPANRFRNFRELEGALLLVFKEHTGSDYLTEKSGAAMTDEEWTNKALSLAALGRHEEALKPFDTALEQAPKDAFLWYKKGDSLMALNRVKEAIRCYDKSIMSDHRVSQAWVSKGMALFQIQDYEKAMFCFNNALKVDPENEAVWARKGMYFNIVGSFRESIDCVEKALLINPRLAEAWYTKSIAHRELGELDEALSSVTRALEENPLWTDAWLLQAQIHVLLRNYQEAIERFEKTLELSPDIITALMGKAHCLYSLCRFQDALNCLNRVTEIDDRNMDAWKSRGDCLFHMGDREEALKNLEIILKKTPRHGPTLRRMGNILEALFSFKEAQLCYDAALKEDPGDQLALYYREGLEKSLKRVYEIAHDEEALLEKRLEEIKQDAHSFLDQEQYGEIEEPSPEKRSLLDMFKKKQKESPEKIRADAMEAYSNGEYEPSVVLFSRYLKSIREDVDAWDMAGRALHRLSASDESHQALLNESMKCFSKALAFSRDHGAYLGNLADFFELEGNLRHAALCIQKRLQITDAGDPEARPLWNRLVQLYEKTGSIFNALACLHEITKRHPEELHTRIKECMLLEQTGFERLSQLKARYLLKMLSSETSDSSALRHKGLVLTIMGRFTEAVRIFDSALKNDQKDIISLIQKGDVLARKGENQAALKAFMLASKYRQQDPTIFYYQGATHEVLEDLDKAIKCYDIALRLNPGYELPLVRKGFCLYKKGQINESLEFYNQVLAKNPYSIYAWEAKGLVMAFQMRYNEAEWCFNRALEIESTTISVLTNKAILYRTMELPQKAIDALDSILALDPIQQEAWNIKALCYHTMGDAEEALKCCDRLLELIPRSSHTWVNRGFLLISSQHYQDALLCFERALEIEYRLPEAFLNRGVTRCLMGNDGQALSDFRIALEINPKSAICWYNQGLWYACRNKIDESIKSFDMAISLDNSLSDAWIDRALAQISLNLYGEALPLAEKATQVDPKNYRAWFVHGLILAQDNKPENHRAAVRSYDKSIRLKSDYVPALLARAISLYEVDRMEEGRESLIRAGQISGTRFSLTGDEGKRPEEELKVSLLYNRPREVHHHYDFSIKPHGHIFFQE